MAKGSREEGKLSTAIWREIEALHEITKDQKYVDFGRGRSTSDVLVFMPRARRLMAEVMQNKTTFSIEHYNWFTHKLKKYVSPLYLCKTVVEMNNKTDPPVMGAMIITWHEYVKSNPI